jgi:hypothetical protein
MDSASYCGAVATLLVKALTDLSAMNDPTWEPRQLLDVSVETPADPLALRVIYRRWDDNERTLGFRYDLAESIAHGSSAQDAFEDIVQILSEPLGRQSSLLVEEGGVWWWGDGYPEPD